MEKIDGLVSNFINASPRRYLLDSYADELRSKKRLTSSVRKALDKAGKLRNEHTLIFYIAGTLSQADATLKSRYEVLQDKIAESSEAPVTIFGYAPHLHGTDPVVDPEVTPAEVRDIDYIFASLIADGHFNFLDPRGHGNAIEAAWAEETGIPSIYLVPTGTKLGRLVRGMWNIAGTIEYSDFNSDGVSQVDEFLRGVKAHLMK